MNIFKLAAGVIAIVTAMGGYMSWKYSTTSSCEAAKQAIILEMPKILDELAEADPRFRALKVSGALFGGVDAFVQGAAAKVASDEVANRNAFECITLVGQREIDAPGFRKKVGERMSDKLAQSLPF